MAFRGSPSEWYAKTAPTLADTTKEKLLRRLEVDVFPWLGDRPIGSIVAGDLIKVIERIAQRGAVPDRRKMMQQWADYLDKLRSGADVIPLHGQAA